MAVLSQPDLRKAVADRRVCFDPPLEENQWGEASVDLRLGVRFTRLRELKDVRISVARGLGSLGAGGGFWITKDLKEQDEFGKAEVFSLGPKEFVLAMTYESISVPNELIAFVEGRSTYARVGLSMHQTAPWIQPGWRGPIVLEIMNQGPLTIDLTPLIDRPCQLTFFQLSTPLTSKLAYGARETDTYRDQDHPLKHRPR